MQRRSTDANWNLRTHNNSNRNLPESGTDRDYSNSELRLSHWPLPSCKQRQLRRVSTTFVRQAFLDLPPPSATALHACSLFTWLRTHVLMQTWQYGVNQRCHWRIQDFSEEGAPNGKYEFERSREARQPCVARLKTSWGSGGRCKPPSGVWGSAPENFENQAFFLSRNGHFWLLSMNTSLAEVKRCFTNHVGLYRSLLCGWRSTRWRCRSSTRWS